jgi:hypothetical protein
MYEQHLKQVHLSRLSPVMWGWKQGYPRKELGVPIKPAYGMGDCGCDAQAPYTDVTGIRPGGNPMWENLYRIGVAGQLSRVAPFGPDAFTNCTNCGVGNDNENGGAGEAMGGLWPFVAAFLGFGAITFLFTRR